jgi:nucleotide-binding universal stress UspA family protein
LIFDRILVAVDGTDVSLRGVKVAAEMVARYNSELILLTVVSVPQHLVLSATMDQRTIGTYIERLAHGSLATSMAVLRETGVGAEVKAVVGPPAETILAEIESSRADLVVMGRRSRYEPKDLILGSVSYRVSRHVRVPILLVP